MNRSNLHSVDHGDLCYEKRVRIQAYGISKKSREKAGTFSALSRRQTTRLYDEQVLSIFAEPGRFIAVRIRTSSCTSHMDR